MAIGDPAEQPATYRTHQEPGGEYPGGIEQLHRRVVGREESRGKVNGTEGVDIEVEPFHQVAGRSADDGKDPLLRSSPV